MRNNFEIPYKNLKYTCDPSVFKFTTTADVKSNYKGLGQQRGIASLEFGLSSIMIFLYISKLGAFIPSSIYLRLEFGKSIALASPR